MLRVGLLLLCVSALLASGCGDDESEPSGSNAGGDSAFERRIDAAQDVSASDFPAPGRQTLRELGNTVGAVQMGLATSEFTQGENRIAFGMIGNDNRFIYGKSAVYIAPTPDDIPRGARSRRPPTRS